MAEYYPPVGFYFEAKISGASGLNDASFSEASGLDAERNIVEISEGGENRFAHRVPDRVKYSNLVLKRGVVAAASPLFDWCKEVLESDMAKAITPRNIDVFLLNSEGDPLLTWNVARAWPVKWSIAGFNAKESEVAMETLEFAYARIERKPAN